MKLLDTNIFIRAMGASTTYQDERMREASLRLFGRIEAGLEEAWTHESVINETLYVLCSPRHYGLSRSDALELLLPLFHFEGLHINRKRLYSDALELFGSVPALDFTDCVLAIHAREDDYELTTFDRRLAMTAGVQVYS